MQQIDANWRRRLTKESTGLDTLTPTSAELAAIRP